MSKADSVEAGKAIFDLVGLLKQIKEDQKHITKEEKKRNEWASWNGDEMLFKY